MKKVKLELLLDDLEYRLNKARVDQLTDDYMDSKVYEGYVNGINYAMNMIKRKLQED